LEYKLTVDDKSEKEIEISVPASELDSIMEQETSKLKKGLSLNGFRKGRVPKSLIKNKYRDTIKAQAIDSLVTKSYLEILEEKKWRPASQAKLLNIEEGDNIKFRLQFEIVPEFEVDNYHHIEIFKSDMMPDDFLLEQGMNELRERFAKIREVSRPGVVDDLVTMDLEVREKDTLKNKQSNIMARIGDRNLPDEINRELVGAKKSENKEIKVGDLIYKMSVKKIEEKELPQIDDDFAKKLNFENTEQLKKKVMEDLKKAEEMRIEDELKESLSHVILERIKVSVPKSLVQNEYEKILQRAKLPDSDANKERFIEIAEKRVRFNLILDKIAEKENIKSTEEETMNAIAGMEIKLNDDNRFDVINYVTNILNREKTIDFLFKNAKIGEKSRIVSPKEAVHDTRSIRH